jgi:hypothetical protein
MNAGDISGQPRGRGRSRAFGVASLTALLAAVALLVAACGGGTKTPSVASLGTTPASSSASSSSRLVLQAPPGGGGGFGGSISTQVGTGAAGVKYSACMQSHGVPDFPEPNAQGTLTITTSPSLNPNSPLFQTAEADCDHLIPAGKGLSQARLQKMKSRLLALAACMRSHGVPNYPDPTFGSGGMVSQGFGRSEGLDPNSPIFQAAQKACRGSSPRLPG